jgi:hypothetical protein
VGSWQAWQVRENALVEEKKKFLKEQRKST